MSQRIPTALALRVYAYGALVASGKTVDMSEHGLLLHIQQDLSNDQLDPGKHLDILLDLAEVNPADCWVPIKVVRKWRDGIAAHFIRAEISCG
jgi:hypothetical protein